MATLNAVVGVAAFTDVRIGTAAAGNVLTASGQLLTGAESVAINVTRFNLMTADVRDSLRWAAGISPVPPGFRASVAWPEDHKVRLGNKEIDGTRGQWLLRDCVCDRWLLQGHHIAGADRGKGAERRNG